MSIISIKDPQFKTSLIISISSYVILVVSNIVLSLISSVTLSPYLVKTLDLLEADVANISNRTVMILSFIIWFIALRNIIQYFVSKNLLSSSKDTDKSSYLIATFYAITGILTSYQHLGDPLTIIKIVASTVIVYLVSRNSLGQSNHKSFSFSLR